MTKQDIINATTELQEALIELTSLDKQDEDIKVKRIKAHKRLSLARDAVRNLIIDN